MGALSSVLLLKIDFCHVLFSKPERGNGNMARQAISLALPVMQEAFRKKKKEISGTRGFIRTDRYFNKKINS